MKKNQNLLAGILLLVGFAVWTFLIQTADVQPIGPNESTVGFAAWKFKRRMEPLCIKATEKA